MVGNFISHKAAPQHLLLFKRLEQLSPQATSISAVNSHLRLSLRGIINVDVAICSESKACDVLTEHRTRLSYSSFKSESPWNQVGKQLDVRSGKYSLQRKQTALTAVEFMDSG